MVDKAVSPDSNPGPGPGPKPTTKPESGNRGWRGHGGLVVVVYLAPVPVLRCGSRVLPLCRGVLVLGDCIGLIADTGSGSGSRTVRSRLECTVAAGTEMLVSSAWGPWSSAGKEGRTDVKYFQEGLRH
jgi:hypothetical protein